MDFFPTQSQSFTPLFSSKNVIVSALSFKSMTHFELFFVYDDGGLWWFSLDCFSFLRELAKSSAEGRDGIRGNRHTGEKRV